MSHSYIVCAALLRNYGTPFIMLNRCDEGWTLPQVLAQDDESDEIAFLRAVRPFGLSTGTKYISRLGLVNIAGSAESSSIMLMTARIHQSLRPSVSVEWLLGKRGEKIPGKEGAHQWTFDLADVDALAQAAISQYGARSVEISRE